MVERQRREFVVDPTIRTSKSPRLREQQGTCRACWWILSGDPMRMLLASPTMYVRTRTPSSEKPERWLRAPGAGLPGPLAASLAWSPGCIINIVLPPLVIILPLLFPLFVARSAVQYCHPESTGRLLDQHAMEGWARSTACDVMVPEFVHDIIDIAHFGNSSSIVADSMHSPLGPFHDGMRPDSPRSQRASRA